ncbi:MAG: translation elongation factor Ts [Gammaproteobacteria bacterium]|jgi:elongation factor Ts|nr:translation elongation factor Ts [Gammaproteobacteria bacterium]
MAITASLVKELRETTGAGMMDCKKALVETNGDAQAAAELLRKKGQASAAKKAGRIAAEGCIQIAASDDGKAIAILEVNCETDFVAKDENFTRFAAVAADMALAHKPASVEALMELSGPDGVSLEETRATLIAKIGENIGVRRLYVIEAQGEIAAYVHSARIGAVVDVVNGDAELGRDVAMHIAAAAPASIAEEDVDPELVAREKRILTEQALQEGKPAEIVEKMIAGRMRKFFAEVTLVGQPFVKDPDTTVGKLLASRGARVVNFVRLEVGEGIEKKKEDFAAEVEAQVRASK